MHCFARDASKAICMASCYPGPHPDDVDDPQLPWSCHMLIPGSTTAPVVKDTVAAVPPARPVPAHNASTVADKHGKHCSEIGDDCTSTGCCKDAGHTCYEKSKYFASCLKDCTPGIHEDEAADLRQPWTCGHVDPKKRPDDGKNVPDISFFCWAVMRTEPDTDGTSEMNLMVAQYPKSAGIFGCDQYMVFCDKDQKDLPFHYTVVSFAARKNVPGALTATWVNADDFISAWDHIVANDDWMRNDWLIKADPDTVFFADSLKRHLKQYDGQRQSGNGVYLRNCQAGPRGLQLFGSVEVVSSTAAKTLGVNKENCRNSIYHGAMGEDMWLQKCLDQSGVRAIEDYQFLADGYCPSAPAIAVCTPPRVVFHPFKMPDQWMKCWHERRGAR